MPTVIDALVVTLGLQTKQFDEGSRKSRADLKKTREEAAKTAKHMEESGKVAAVFFSKLRNEALMFVGVLAGAAGIKSFTTNTIGQARSLGFMSQSLDMNINRLQAWEKAARQAGASAGDMNAQLAESQNAIAMTRRGQLAPGVEEFRLRGGLGNVQNMTPEQYLMARFAVIQRIAKQHGVTDARLAGQQMGVSDNLFNFALQGNGKIQQQLSFFSRISSFTKKDAENANKLTNQFDILGDRVQVLGVRLGTALMPYLQKLIDWFNSIAQWVDTHQDTITQWMNQAVEAIKGFWKEVSQAVKAVGGWKAVLIALAGLKILSMLSPLWSLAAALTAIGGGLKMVALGGAALPVLAGLASAALLTYAGEHHNEIQGKLNPDQGQINTAAAKAPGRTKAAQAAMDYFTSHGYTKEAAAAIVGGLQQESSMRPNAVNGSHFGLAQWSTKRQADFKRVYGFDIQKATFEQQLAFIDWELRNTHKGVGSLIRDSHNVWSNSHLLFNQYEAPGDNSLAARMGNAQALLGVTPADYEKAGLTGIDFPNRGNGNLPLNARSHVGPSSDITTGGNSSTMNVNGPVTIHSSATNAKDLLGDLDKYIRRNILASNVNTGVQ